MANIQPLSPVQFTKESAERIADVVRAVETAPPQSAPLVFDAAISSARQVRQVRVGAWSGPWPINASATVTFQNAPITSVSAINLTWPAITSESFSQEPCLVAKDGTAWYLVTPKLYEHSAIALSAVTVTATLSTADCSIIVGVTTSGYSVSLFKYKY